ncbi:NAD(P)H-binding protein [Bacillus sp. ISL-40]|uniref:NAD(P)H-binding protein n=1 Tax=unclassified Bacillus (in: firmicutes) TaxID=185979 RepID=UPI001BE61701|nr:MULTISPECIES: NAD(P)H-binding protein [unclassified Bacillus (in: firmicutes)]MBT2700312.1 NAD(P)H-binding protein [Bacillus sp. ISL-40]MBT2742836.1 NAD(P)H-binding protein [Bacillus sp. ISL-77]
MKILILGAAGQISRMLTERLLDETVVEIVLYARRAHSRLKVTSKRVEIISGDFQEKSKLVSAMSGVDVVYLNDMFDVRATQSIVSAMGEAGVKRLIGATALGIYDEVPGPFGSWNDAMVGSNIPLFKSTAKVVEESDLDYTLLRLTWLYNQEGNEAYHLTLKGEPFIGAQVTRQAAARLVMNLLADNTKYICESLGVSEPNTDFEKPSFY